jgi:hypothetical protein
MYRQVLTPTEHNNIIPVTIPREWYGQEVEIIIHPVIHNLSAKKNQKRDIMKYFGAWKTDKSAEEIIAEIRDSRTFGKTRFLENL